MNGVSIIYKGENLTLTKYFGDLCLFIRESSQRDMPKMQFVGGYPDEWCIYLKDLTEEEKDSITDMSGHVIDLEDTIGHL